MRITWTKRNQIQQNFHSFKHKKIKVKNTPKTNLKRRNGKMFSPPDKTIPRSEGKMKVVHKKKRQK